MPTAYFGCKYRPNGENRPFIESVAGALEAAGWAMLNVERDVEGWGRVELPAEQLMEETFVMIGGSDLVVIDLAEKGVGLGIEAGYAHALGIPVLVSAPHGADVSPTLTGIARRVVRYDRPDEIAAGVVG